MVGFPWLIVGNPTEGLGAARHITTSGWLFSHQPSSFHQRPGYPFQKAHLLSSLHPTCSSHLVTDPWVSVSEMLPLSLPSCSGAGPCPHWVWTHPPRSHPLTLVAPHPSICPPCDSPESLCSPRRLLPVSLPGRHLLIFLDPVQLSPAGMSSLWPLQSLVPSSVMGDPRR